MNKAIILSFLIGLFGYSTELRSQDDLQKDELIVYLKSGTKLRGKLIEWKDKESIMLDIHGNLISIDQRRVKKIVQGGTDIKNKVSNYNFQEKGIYHQFTLNFISGNDGPRANRRPGLGAAMSTGYRFNQYLGIAGGVGFDQYIFGTDERFLSLFTEFSGFVLKENFSPMYSLKLGYGFGFSDEEAGFIESKGGYLVHPAIGFRFGQNKLKWTMDIGYKFQKANLSYVFWGELREQELLYKRLTLRLGLMF